MSIAENATLTQDHGPVLKFFGTLLEAQLFRAKVRDYRRPPLNIFLQTFFGRPEETYCFGSHFVVTDFPQAEFMQKCTNKMLPCNYGFTPAQEFGAGFSYVDSLALRCPAVGDDSAEECYPNLIGALAEWRSAHDLWRFGLKFQTQEETGKWGVRCTKKVWVDSVRESCMQTKDEPIKAGLLCDILCDNGITECTGFRPFAGDRDYKLRHLLWVDSWELRARGERKETATQEQVKEMGGFRSWLLVAIPTDHEHSDYSESARLKSNEKQIRDALEGAVQEAEGEGAVRTMSPVFWSAGEQYFLVPASNGVLKAICELNGALQSHCYLDEEEADQMEREQREEGGQVELCAREDRNAHGDRRIRPHYNPEWLDEYDFTELEEQEDGSKVCPDCDTCEHLEIWRSEEHSGYGMLRLMEDRNSGPFDLLLCKGPKQGGEGCGCIWKLDSPEVNVAQLREDMEHMGHHSPVEGPAHFKYITGGSGGVLVAFPDLPIMEGVRETFGFFWKVHSQSC